MNSIRFFFTPVVYPQGYNKNLSETLLEGVDSYFYLGGKKAQVISSHSNTVKNVALINFQSNYIMTALKVASYFLVVPFFVALTAKIILRSLHSFHLVSNNSQTTNLNNNNSLKKPLPHPKAFSYICPPLARHFDAPLPCVKDPSQVVGIYGNILYPQDKELELQKKLYSWIQESVENETPVTFPLTSEEILGMSLYMIERFPAKAARVYLASCLREESEKSGQDIKAVCANAKKNTMGLYKTFNELALMLPKNTHHHKVLSNKLTEQADKLEKQIDGYIYFFQNKVSPEKRKQHLLQEQFELIQTPFNWDLRLQVFKQMIEKVQALSPNSPYFLALQEVTPEALSGLKKTLADKNLRWISYNNLSGNVTLKPKQEKVPGEATSFTTTIALSQDLEVLKIDLGDLPSESGSIRKILGVKVKNKYSNKVFNLFTTHTDHKVQNNLYTKTAKKIHDFASGFFQQGKVDEARMVIGGDLNAFEDKGGDAYLKELRQLFRDSQDFRETDYYSPSQIAWSTLIGRSGNPAIPQINEKGIIEKSALDHILVGKDIQLKSAAREALVYDDSGKLLDYHKDKGGYVKNLRKRQTFSDHLFNIVRFN